MIQVKSELSDYIRSVSDFPIPGAQYKDITPLLREPKAFRQAIDAFVARYRPRAIDAILGIESRGFIFSAPIAYELGVSLVPVRKFGKLPGATYEVEYYLHFGADRLQIHQDALTPGARVVVFDDLLASGGTIAAACELVARAGGIVEEVACLVELPTLKGREKLTKYEVFSLIQS